MCCITSRNEKAFNRFVLSRKQFRKFLGACAAISIGFGALSPAYADDIEAAAKHRFFEAVKSARIAAGTKINCCGKGDAVKVRMMGNTHNGFLAEVIDTMHSVNGKVGDVLTVGRDTITAEIASPFPEPVVFINSQNRAYCISFGSGG